MQNMLQIRRIHCEVYVGDGEQGQDVSCPYDGSLNWSISGVVKRLAKLAAKAAMAKVDFVPDLPSS